MTLKERFVDGLIGARSFSDQLLADFQTPEQWVYQVHDKANHALWFAGHLAVVDNFMITLIDPAKGLQKPDYEEKFGMGSAPTNNPGDYPPVEEVLAYMRDRREVLLEILNDLTDEDLAKETPDDAPPFLDTYASVFQLAAWHEGFHAGQVSVAARALGAAPRV